MGESTKFSVVQSEILGEGEEFPNRRQGFLFPKIRDKKVQGNHKKIDGQDAVDSFDKKLPDVQGVPFVDLGKQLRGDQKSA